MDRRSAKKMSAPPPGRPVKVPVRAERFSVHLPVRFRMLQGPTWLEGTTVNISESGVLFRTTSPLTAKTEIEMRLELPVVVRGEAAGEIVCLATVVRSEQSPSSESLRALAVAIKGYRIARGHKSRNGSWLGKMLPADPN